MGFDDIALKTNLTTQQVEQCMFIHLLLRRSLLNTGIVCTGQQLATPEQHDAISKALGIDAVDSKEAVSRLRFIPHRCPDSVHATFAQVCLARPLDDGLDGDAALTRTALTQTVSEEPEIAYEHHGVIEASEFDIFLLYESLPLTRL